MILKNFDRNVPGYNEFGGNWIDKQRYVTDKLFNAVLFNPARAIGRLVTGESHIDVTPVPTNQSAPIDQAAKIDTAATATPETKPNTLPPN